MKHNLSARRLSRGFTLVELLVVTLILSILMAVALPLYLSSVADARTKTCQANMQTIANAVQAAHVRKTDSTYTGGYMGRVDDTKCATGGDLADLQKTPICPNGGHYDVNASGTGFVVTCSDSRDGSFTPGVGVTGASNGNGAGASTSAGTGTGN